MLTSLCLLTGAFYRISNEDTSGIFPETHTHFTTYSGTSTFPREKYSRKLLFQNNLRLQLRPLLFFFSCYVFLLKRPESVSRHYKNAVTLYKNNQIIFRLRLPFLFYVNHPSHFSLAANCCMKAGSFISSFLLQILQYVIKVVKSLMIGIDIEYLLVLVRQAKHSKVKKTKHRI